MNLSKDCRKFESLRNLAEEMVGHDSNAQKAAVHDEVKGLLHELQVYQAELELQNEELRSLQSKLESSRNKYFELFDFAPVGYIIIDDRYTITEINSTALEQLDRNRTEMVDRPLLGSVSIKDHSRMVSFLRTIASSSERHEILVDLTRSDNTVIHAMIDAVRSEKEDGTSHSHLLTLTDLTELRKAQDAVEKSESIYRALVHSSADHIFLLSTEGRYLASNDNVSQLGIKDSSVLIGKHFSEIYPADVATFYQEKFNEVIATGQPVAFEHDLPCDAYELFHHDKLYPIFQGQKVWAIGGICQDITKEKAAQRKNEQLAADLRQKQKLESLGTLAGGIAHDFNNILAAVIGYTELSLEGTEKGSILEYDMQKVMTAALRAKNLVAQILAFSRKSEEKLEPVPIDEVAKEVLKLIRPSTPTTINIVYTAESNSKILGNSTQIHQVLMNLCSNGAHAMKDKGGTLTIGIKDMHFLQTDHSLVPDMSPGKYVEIQVSDTGIGIPPDMLEKVFEPYFTTKSLGTGTGMGLSVVHGIVESYGGKIRIESQVAEGTTFYLYLPVAKSQDDKASLLLRDHEEISLGSGRILFVDDEQMIVLLNRRLLSRLGYEVTALTDSKEALRLFRLDPSAFDLVITDMTMPGLSGEDLARQLLEISPDTPIIMCSGYSSTMTHHQAQQIGIRECLTKPVDRRDLISTIRKFLN